MFWEGLVSEGQEHDESRPITDSQFMGQLALLHRTRRFLIEEGVQVKGAQEADLPLSLGRLNLLRFSEKSGRAATLAEWNLLEQRQQALQQYFTPELSRRLRTIETRKIITHAPVFLLIIAGIALALAIFPPHQSLFTAEQNLVIVERGWQFGAYMAWTSSLGGLGALGFLAVNSLAIQNDATFDIGDKGLVVMRIILGALFGCIVSLPFCWEYFIEFATSIISATAHIAPAVPSGEVGARSEPQRGILLLVPFLLGFSTTLVMAVLNRLIAGVEAVFGIDLATAKARANLTARNAPPEPGANANRPADHGVNRPPGGG